MKFGSTYICAMLLILQFLHIYWTIFIIKAVYNGIVKSKTKVDYDIKEMKNTENVET